jgi:hypothetical protein
MSSYLGTFVLDFMSTDFKTDTDTATALLSQLKEECGFDKSLEAFAILDPVECGLDSFKVVYRRPVRREIVRKQLYSDREF